MRIQEPRAEGQRVQVPPPPQESLGPEDWAPLTHPSPPPSNRLGRPPFKPSSLPALLPTHPGCWQQVPRLSHPGRQAVVAT